MCHSFGVSPSGSGGAVNKWAKGCCALGHLTGKINPNLSGLLMYPGISHKSDFSSAIGSTRRALSIDNGITL
eukprot:4055396-Pleurochrysis_carterae.AAC.1